MLTFAAMAGLPEEEYMALNYRLMEYPLWGDLCGMLHATNALLGDDEFCMDYLEAYRDGLFGPIKD